ncbi:MAG: DNA polymerase III subunit beta [bacterium]|nr:DNA polymerase III subunit beta [bacterium]
MNTQVSKNNFKEGISLTERVTAKSSSLPILASILLCAKKSSLEIIGTDLEIGVRYRVLANAQDEGNIAVPAKSLSSFISIISGDQVFLETKGEGLVVKSGGFETKLKTLSAEEFPIIPSLKGDEKVVSMSARELCDGISQVVGFAGTMQAHPELSGVYFSFSGEELRVASTDIFRLAERIIILPKKIAEEANFILPQKAAKELLSLFGDRDGDVFLHISSTQITCEYNKEKDPLVPHIQLVSRVMEGEFPAYGSHIPTTGKASFRMSKEDALSHFRAAGIFAGKSNEVRLVIRPKKGDISVLAQNTETGESSSRFQGEGEGEELRVSFNWKFLVDGLSQIKTEHVDMLCSSEEGPTLLRPVGAKNFFYLIAPLRA